MRIWIDIENASRTLQGEGPIVNVQQLEVVERLNEAGEFSFTLPATDPRSLLVLPRRTALAYGMLDGVRTFLGGGPIDDIRLRLRDGGVFYQVRGGDLMRELTRRTVGELALTGSGNANLGTILLPATSGLGWSYTIDGAVPDFQARLVEETVLGALVAVQAKVGGHFSRDTSAGQIRHVRWAVTAADSGYVATNIGDPDAIRTNPKALLITDAEVLEDAYDLKNAVVCYGAGEGQTRLRLNSATQWPGGGSLAGGYTLDGETYWVNQTTSIVWNATSQATYGEDRTALAFNDIAPIHNTTADIQAAGNFLLLAAVRWLHTHAWPYRSYRLNVVGRGAGPRPGQTLRVQLRRFVDGQPLINIDQTLYVLETRRRIDENGIQLAELVVASRPRWPESDDRYVAQELRRTQVTQAYPQTGPGLDTLTYREHVDDSHSARFDFWLGKEVTTVNSVLVRIRTGPLRSTVKTVAGSANVAIDNLDVAAILPDHQHRWDIDGSTYVGPPGSNDYWLFVRQGVSFDGVMAAGAGAAEFNILTGETVYLNDNEQEIDIVGTASGTIDLSNAISMQYGLYDAGSYYSAMDLEYSVNGGASWTAVPAGTIVPGTPWYQLDITAAVSSDGRPVVSSGYNYVDLRVREAVKNGRAAQITVQIERRAAIQSVALL